MGGADAGAVPVNAIRVPKVAGQPGAPPTRLRAHLLGDHGRRRTLVRRVARWTQASGDPLDPWMSNGLSAIFSQRSGGATCRLASDRTDSTRAEVNTACPVAGAGRARIALADERDVDLGLFARMAVTVGARRGVRRAALARRRPRRGARPRSARPSFNRPGGFGSRRSRRRHVEGHEDPCRANLRARSRHDRGAAAIRVRRVETALACGLVSPNGHVSLERRSRRLHPRPPNRFTYDWIQIDRAAGDGTHVRFHDLRHYHGTMLVGAGVPIASVRDRLGHSSLTVTNIYVDGRPEWDRRSAEIMGGLLDGPDSSAAPVGTAQ